MNKNHKRIFKRSVTALSYCSSSAPPGPRAPPAFDRETSTYEVVPSAQNEAEAKGVLWTAVTGEAGEIVR